MKSKGKPSKKQAPKKSAKKKEKKDKDDMSPKAKKVYDEMKG